MLRRIARLFVLAALARWLLEWLRRRQAEISQPAPAGSKQNQDKLDDEGNNSKDEEVPRDKLDLRDDPALISPPIVADPLYQCAERVVHAGNCEGPSGRLPGRAAATSDQPGAGA
jgi:hypothetical protein